jgi:hypothetical protein
MRWIVGPVCALVLSACGILDRSELSDFTPTGPNSFVYRAGTSYFFTPGANSAAEHTRREWLNQYLRRNDMCDGGYVIVRRDVRFRMTGTLGNPIDDILYYGRCQAAASG